MGEVACALCGQCINVCPVGALTEKDYTQEVWKAIHDPDKVVVVQDALAVRAALGEEFGFPPGTLVTGKMLEALRRWVLTLSSTLISQLTSPSSKRGTNFSNASGKAEFSP